MKQIGTVEILVQRLYTDENGQDIMVDPGTYPVVQDSDLYYFQMEGYPSQAIQPAARRVPGAQSLFAIYPAVDVKVSDYLNPVTSKKMTRQEFEELLADRVCKEGSGSQRLRFHLFTAVES